MSRARTLAGAIGSDGALNVADVAGLAAVASSGSASDLATGTLPIARIADGTVANAKLASDLDASKLTAGTLPIARVADGAVVTAKLADSSIHTGKIADSAVTAAKMHTTAVTDKLGYTPANKAGDTFGGPIELNGNRVRDTSGATRVYRNITPGFDNYGGGVGAVVIETNIPHTGNMMSIKIAGYGYNAAIPWEIEIGVYYGEGSLYSRAAYTMGSPFGASVRLAKNTSSGKLAIILGQVDDQYGTSLTVDRFIQSYADRNPSYADGWTITRLTSLAAYSLITTIPVFTALTNRSIATTAGITTTASGPFGYGNYPTGYALGWYQGTPSSANTYVHLTTTLWGGGSPGGNYDYIMGGFKIIGYLYSAGQQVMDLHQFHNWSGGLSQYTKTSMASDPGNLVYVGSSGYVVIRLRSDSYAMYNIDLYQHPMYPPRNILVSSTTFTNSATI